MRATRFSELPAVPGDGYRASRRYAKFARRKPLWVPMEGNTLKELLEVAATGTAGHLDAGQAALAFDRLVRNEI